VTARRLFAIVASKPALVLQLSPVPFRLDSSPFGGACGQGGPPRRLLVERGLDEFVKSRPRNLAISMAASMSVGVHDQHPIPRQFATKPGKESQLGFRDEAVRLAQIPTQSDPSARGIDVLSSRAARTTGQFDDFRAGDSIPTRQEQVTISPCIAPLHHFLPPETLVRGKSYAFGSTFRLAPSWSI